jgi:hypothetical protein
MKIYTPKLLLILIVVSSTIAVSAQTREELRARYGEPQRSRSNESRQTVERYLVRPSILLTIWYTKEGRPCEAVLKPVPSSTPKEGRGEHAPEGDYMSTAEVIKLLNELVAVEQRGKKTGEGSVNGGDPQMKLHHPGCWGQYFAIYENVTISCSTWCWGGTFSATIQWNKESCSARGIRLNKS